MNLCVKRPIVGASRNIFLVYRRFDSNSFEILSKWLFAVKFFICSFFNLYSESRYFFIRNSDFSLSLSKSDPSGELWTSTTSTKFSYVTSPDAESHSILYVTSILNFSSFNETLPIISSESWLDIFSLIFDGSIFRFEEFSVSLMPQFVHHVLMP